MNLITKVINAIFPKNKSFIDNLEDRQLLRIFLPQVLMYLDSNRDDVEKIVHFLTGKTSKLPEKFIYKAPNISLQTQKILVEFFSNGGSTNVITKDKYLSTITDKLCKLCTILTGKTLSTVANNQIYDPKLLSQGLENTMNQDLVLLTNHTDASKYFPNPFGFKNYAP